MPTNLEIRIKAIQKFLLVANTGIIDAATCTALEKALSISNIANTIDARKKEIQKKLGFKGLDIDGIYGPATITKIEQCCTSLLPALPNGACMIVSYKGLDLIINSEISSKALYNTKYKFPIWPQGDSGITIGIGYDIGYASAASFESDWKDILSTKDFNLLKTVVGKKGIVAKNALSAAIKNIEVSWENALTIFYTKSIPLYAKQVAKIYPGIEKLPPDAQAALLSLVYNRGASLTGDRRIEMKNIAAYVQTKNCKKIASEIRNMKRLWDVSLQGLLIRREKEAVLVENGNYFVVAGEYVFV
jgi:hypothetical protein